MKRCIECGTEVCTNARGGRVLCDECRLELDRLYHERHKKEKVVLKDTLIVMEDPDPAGGFPKGAQLLKEEAKCMCRSNHQAFTIGTLLKDWQGNIYKVIQSPTGGQKIIPT